MLSIVSSPSNSNFRDSMNVLTLNSKLHSPICRETYKKNTIHRKFSVSQYHAYQFKLQRMIT